MLAVIDNYDSFTFNVVQYLGELGAEVHVFKNDEITVPELKALNPERLLISPGPGRPEDAGITLESIRAFLGRTPLLGVCLGHQAIVMALGGTLKKAPKIIHGKTSEIQHDGAGLFEGIEAPFEAMRYHSWIIDEESLPHDLRVTAKTSDGVPMAIAHQHHPVYGVQFHPESILTPPREKDS